MKLKAFSKLAAIFFLLFAMSSCEVIGDIFKAGVWVGIVIVVAIIAVIIFIVSKLGGKN